MNLSPIGQGVLAVALLGLIVEGVVFLYQLVSASDSRLYAKVLRDQYGAWVERVIGIGPVEWHDRGPLQFVRLRPRGRLSPLSKRDLMRAFEDQTSGWFRRTFDVLRAEAALEEAGLRSRSPLFEQFRKQLGERQSLPETPAPEGRVRMIENGREEIRRFFELWDGDNPPPWAPSMGESVLAKLPLTWATPTGESTPAKVLLSGFRLTFFPDLEAVETHYTKLMTTYSLERHRRGVRQRFIAAGLVVGCFNTLRAGSVVTPFHAPVRAIASYVAAVILTTLVATWVSRALTPAAESGKDASTS